ncbi:MULTISPECIES: L-rhamnose mutarotase [unclassified Chelatococcus]|uniref:L-rhamnose mutarotase n=1 Tax=unclassified Chelatococcus TaxID=2638111 RepID=UPI001BD123E1|nr:MULTISPECIES: L-rhamnose mutarotase [unclassified Chelatococcus]CAH1648194.1 L-rhamnose mutarotase [Hyphomicrobiales bacterium]MBS7742040.1 L-rhamnose mutarotase [Chelatococcus sp. HY11]MBX3541162.1 L-rhamnose mutarotase [Chelatococcus sp.]MCO5074943.1 L-rhamnose mutarotase [Chelatococcus sp.]CAH1690519.1 L-rhamnose mutarotase [Hyphomicrobiales bacterium]
MGDLGLHVSGFVLRVRPGKTEEYKRRHAEIWPEMLRALRASGVVSYDIFLNEPNRMVFGHLFRRHALDPNVPEDPVIIRWRGYMADVLEMAGDQPLREPLEHVFHMEFDTGVHPDAVRDA